MIIVIVVITMVFVVVTTHLVRVSTDVPPRAGRAVASYPSERVQIQAWTCK